MNQLIKIPWDQRNKVFFASDFHYNHRCDSWDVPIWKKRGYDSVEHSNESIIKQLNDSLKEDDILFYMGDMMLNGDEQIATNFLRRINCQNINFIWGNHDQAMFRLYKQELKQQYGIEGVEIYPLRMNNINFLGNYVELLVGKQKIILSHYSIRSWNNSGKSSWNIHGHSHNTDKTRNADYHMGKSLDVSWDWHKNVWPFDQVMDVMSTKEIHLVDHH